MENNTNSFKLTKTENKARTKWLFLSTILPAVFLVFCMIFVTGSGFTSLNFMIIRKTLPSFIVIAGGLYLNYYCAYKNPGTILLLLMIIGISLNIIVNLPIAANLALTKSSPLSLSFILSKFMFEIALLYYSYKLRNINKNIKNTIIKSSPIYINAMSTLSTSNNLGELNEKFIKLKNSNSSEATAVILARAYKEQKKRLSL
jgi:hypothetical protein